MKRNEQAFRGAWLSFRSGRPLRSIVGIALLAIVLAAASVEESPSTVQRAMLIVAMVLVFGFTRRIIAGDRSNGRWWLLFQRPVSPMGHYARMVGFAGTCILLGLLIAALVLSATISPSGGGLRIVWGSLAGAVVWSSCVFAIGVGISSLVRDHDLELLILFYLVSAAQVLIVQQLNLGLTLSTLLTWLLMPIDSIFLLWEWFVSGVWTLDPSDLAHLIIYPAVWLMIAVARLRSDSFGEFS